MSLRHIFYLFCLWIPLAAASETRQWQDLSGIPKAAQHYLEGVLQAQFREDDISVQVAPIDPRLRLAACDNPLTYEMHSKQLSASNVTLRVRCEAGTPWSFYLTSSVERLRHILVANRNIGRGDILSMADFELQPRNVSTLGNSTLSDPARAVGQEARRPIGLGDSIRTTHLTAPRVVEKGDAVTVTASAGGIAVLTSGVALRHGKVGDQIRVQNLKSERIIKARVTARGQVEVVM